MNDRKAIVKYGDSTAEFRVGVKHEYLLRRYEKEDDKIGQCYYEYGDEITTPVPYGNISHEKFYRKEFTATELLAHFLRMLDKQKVKYEVEYTGVAI